MQINECVDASSDARERKFRLERTSTRTRRTFIPVLRAKASSRKNYHIQTKLNSKKKKKIQSKCEIEIKHAIFIPNDTKISVQSVT